MFECRYCRYRFEKKGAECENCGGPLRRVPKGEPQYEQLRIDDCLGEAVRDVREE